jgi:hypothetical protein
MDPIYRLICDAEECERKNLPRIFSQSFYHQAARLQEEDLFKYSSKPRTLGIMVVSAVSLYWRAGAYIKARELAAKWLDSGVLPLFAQNQLQEIIGEKP